MKNLNLLLLICIVALFSCGDDPTDSALSCSTAFSQEFQEELDNISTAAAVYGQDPSTANCQAFKDSYLAYIDALEDWEECATINNSIAEYNMALEGARASINSLVC